MKMKQQKCKTPRKRIASSTAEYEPVEVFCRLLPLDIPYDEHCVKQLNATTVQLNAPEASACRNGQVKEYQYKFEQVFCAESSQKTIFDKVALPLIEDLIFGRNGLLFSYGITGSGKTYTMTGTPTDQGVLPRCLDVVFNSISNLLANKYVFRPNHLNGFEVQSEADAMLERQQRDIMPGLTAPRTPGVKRSEPEEQHRLRESAHVTDVDEDSSYAVFVSYIEIYNNYIYDLLEELPYDPITGYKLPQSKSLRTDSRENMYVYNCVEVEVKSTEQAFEVFYKGQKRRKVAHTSLNAESSRSHSVFNIRLVQAPLDHNGEELLQCGDVCVSQLSLVDLAGSERSNRTRNVGDRMREAGNINQSLMTLRTCLELLRENQKTASNRESLLLVLNKNREASILNLSGYSIQLVSGCKNLDSRLLVPYRDSRLTHLFKNYFDGDGRVRMIVCVNPRAEEYEETVHVMKFAELSQEVLVTKSYQSQAGNGLTPGRRRLHQDNFERLVVGETVRAPFFTAPAGASRVPVVHTLGPPFPMLELAEPSDSKTLANLSTCLGERAKRRQSLLADYQQRATKFRAMVVESERTYRLMSSRVEDLESCLTQEKLCRQRLEARLRNAERKGDEVLRRTKDLEKDNQALSLKVQDSNWKIQVEKSEKDRIKCDFHNRININNKQWERNLEQFRELYSADAEAKLEVKERKLDMLRDIVNTDDAPRRGPPRIAPKPRIQPTALSVASSTGSSAATPKPRLAGNVRSKATPVQPRSRIPSAKSMQGLNEIGSTPASKKSTAPVYNTRYHRRSKSSGNATDVWLDHRPVNNVDTIILDGVPYMPRAREAVETDVLNQVTSPEGYSFGEFLPGCDSNNKLPVTGGEHPTDTVMQPKMRKKRSVSQLEVGDTRLASKYMLTHQEQDSNDDVITKLIKGDVIPTASGGAAVVFNDVEELRQTSPGSRKRRSNSVPCGDVPDDWTDTETRCHIGIEGHAKRLRPRTNYL